MAIETTNIRNFRTTSYLMQECQSLVRMRSFIVTCDLRVATTSLSPAFQNQTGLVIASMISITAGITVASIATKFSTTMFLLFSRK